MLIAAAAAAAAAVAAARILAPWILDLTLHSLQLDQRSGGVHSGEGGSQSRTFEEPSSGTLLACSICASMRVCLRVRLGELLRGR